MLYNTKEKKQKPFYKRWWFIVIAVFIVLGAIGSLFEDEETASMDKVETVAPIKETKEEKPKVKKAKTPDVIAADFIKKKFGINKEEKKKAVVSTSFENGILKAVALKESSWSAKSAKESFLFNASEFMETMKSLPEVQQATLIVQVPLTDQYGNTENDDAFRVTLSRETLEKINFEGFNVDNFPMIADDYWEHPALSAK